jgi:hypothetical protein
MFCCARQGMGVLKSERVADALEYPDHFDDKRDHQGRADEQNKTGGKKGHDERERVFKPVGGHEQVNAEYKKESRYH